jgi:hypothetical protein
VTKVPKATPGRARIPFCHFCHLVWRENWRFSLSESKSAKRQASGPTPRGDPGLATESTIDLVPVQPDGTGPPGCEKSSKTVGKIALPSLAP